jgi:FtsP/CotA-like multicopper oxidase with cupredoxin domain
MNITVRNVETTQALPTSRRPSRRPARPRFPRRAWLVTAAVALAALLPASGSAAAAAAAPTCTTPPTGQSQPLTPVTAITSNNGKLQAVIKVKSGQRCISGPTNYAATLMYFEGYNAAKPSQVWPTSQSAGPGPTLQAELGDVVQISFLNEVAIKEFPGSLEGACDQAGYAGPPANPTWYPDTDIYPNCFHASNSANLHFHGTHVTPSTTGDNILLTVRPLAMNEKQEHDVQELFEKEIFQHCELNRQPQKWEDLPKSWRETQEGLVKQYDKTAPYTGPDSNTNGLGLPHKLQLWPQDQKAIDNGSWPQFYVGSYPFCFQIPRCPVTEPCDPSLQMGQAPGTHWYHSHVHGSTAFDMFNGMAGAFIITDTSKEGYDGKLNSHFGTNAQGQPNLVQQVLVLQQLTTVLNLKSAITPAVPPAIIPPKLPGPPKTLVNGQFQPTITMYPGQVQLWRIINASVQNFISATFSPAGTAGTPGITFKQTAQDGVQLSQANYGAATNGTLPITLAPGNRVDLLVQAPSTATTTPYTLTIGGKALLNISVTGSGPAMATFPTQAEFPVLPNFLKDIPPPDVTRNIRFGSQAPDTTPAHAQLVQFTIDGHPFQEKVIHNKHELNSTEEFTVYNEDALSVGKVTHPFHIHVNPFQVIEVFTPSPTSCTVPVSSNVWADTFPIPSPAVCPLSGTASTCPLKYKGGPWPTTKPCPGYFKMRTRFADFTGTYVEHCHVLSHEDRGMMQLVEVEDNKTSLAHH